MSELIPHEIQITAINSRSRNKANHLVQRHTTIHHKVMICRLHVPIHIGIDKAEDDRLVAHQSLVVALGIADGLLVGTAVRRFPPDSRRMPVFVFLFLDSLNPEVRDIHCHTVVEAIAAVFNLGSQAGHTADFLGNRDSVLIYFMD